MLTELSIKCCCIVMWETNGIQCVRNVLNSLSNKESAANNVNEFKHLLAKFDTGKISFDSIAAVIKHKGNFYEYY